MGGGFTGLWAALQAREADPRRDVVLLEGDRIAEGASGRNGGFADPSITHGLLNGLHHFPEEIGRLVKLGDENFEGFLAALARYAIDARYEGHGVLAVAEQPHLVESVREYHGALRRFGEQPTWLDREALRAELDSPCYHAGLWRHRGGVLDPARLAWGLRDAALRLGVRVHEGTRVEGIRRAGAGLELRCGSGSVRVEKVVVATNAYRSPVRAVRRGVIPVWDYALVTEPLSEEQLSRIGWRNRQAVGDNSNQFHYYRLTDDDRILWGGYDAIYHYGSGTGSELQQRPATFEKLAYHFLETFPQLEDVRFSHRWGGPIGTTTRFCLDVGTALGGRVAWAVGYTGLGVTASRFGARVALDLLDYPDADHLTLRMLRRRPFPWPPEPLRYLAVQVTRRALERADRNAGRRGPWLRLLDRLGLGYDS